MLRRAPRVSAASSALDSCAAIRAACVLIDETAEVVQGISRAEDEGERSEELAIFGVGVEWVEDDLGDRGDRLPVEW